MRYTSFAVAVLMLLSGCANGSKHENSSEHHENETSHEGHEHAPGIIEFSKEKADAAGLLTEVVAEGQFNAVLKVSGEILPAQGDEASVVATSSGIVTFDKNKILPGVKVAKGANLAYVSAREMAAGDPAAKAKAEYEAAKKQFDRAEALLKSNAVSQKAYEQAKKDYEVAKTQYDAYSDRVGDKGVAVQSPLSGYIKQVFVNEGDYVEEGQLVASVAQNNRLQLQADLPEKFWSSAEKISGANFRPSYSDKTYRIKDLGGRIVSVGKTSSVGSFYLPVIFEFANSGDFVSGAFCDIYLFENVRDGVISLPESALTEEQSVYYVYLKVGEDDYKKQEVKIGASDGIRREILKGLAVGDEVVTEGAYQVKLASVTGAIPGHTHNH